jgi:hypothetical protein
VLRSLVLAVGSLFGGGIALAPSGDLVDHFVKLPRDGR